jgi:ATP-dependent RNA helicase RhlE
VDAVTHVVNYELPNVPEAYVHRIGRTARAGAAGVAIALCSDDERSLLRDIQKLTRQTIPAFDRRNDRSLGALAAVERTSMPERPPHKPHPARAAATAPRGRRRGRGFGGAAVRGGGQPSRPQGGKSHAGRAAPAARWSPAD